MNYSKGSSMKKLNLSMMAVFAIGSHLIAGGDIAPVEPVVDAPVIIESNGDFYLGLAYGYMDVKEENTLNHTNILDDNFDDIMLQAGYNFNKYVAIEGRYWFGLSDTTISGEDVDLDAWGLYVKPQYPVTDTFNIYTLLGYGAAEFDISNSTILNSDTMDGFSWGLGASYTFTENVSVFIDYVSIYDDDEVNYDDTIDAWNFGVTYNF
jgi:opacity protein-like surface antigen